MPKTILVLSVLLLSIPHSLTHPLPNPKHIGPDLRVQKYSSYLESVLLPETGSHQLETVGLVTTPEPFEPVTTAEPIPEDADPADGESEDPSVAGGVPEVDNGSTGSGGGSSGTEGGSSGTEGGSSGSEGGSSGSEGGSSGSEGGSSGGGGDAPMTDAPTTTTTTTTSATTTTTTATTTATMATEPPTTTGGAEPPASTQRPPQTVSAPTLPTTTTIVPITTTTTTTAPSTVIPVCRYGEPILRESDIEGEDTDTAGFSSSRKPGVWYCPCLSTYITEAGAQTLEQGWLISMAPSQVARELTGPFTFRFFRSLFDDMWEQAQSCFVWNDFSEDEMRTMYLQFLCHAKFGVFGLGGSTWDLESWKGVPTEFYALSSFSFPEHKCNEF